MSYIDSIFFMDSLTKIEKAISSQYQTSVVNLSHWDTSNEYQDEMLKVLQLECTSPPWDYIYSYSIPVETRRAIIQKLGMPLDCITNHMVLFLQSGTQSIINVANLIKQQQIKKVCILKPAYFSVAYTFDALGIRYGYESVEFEENNIHIPIEKITQEKYDCIWFTSPLFGVGKYLSEEHISEINTLLDKGVMVVTDESFSTPGHELIRFFYNSPNHIGIYCPHKAIAMNGIKFSVVICHLSFEDLIEQWVDVLSGALSKSNCDAVNHYLTDNFVVCYNASQAYINRNRKLVERILSNYSCARLLCNEEGSCQYITVLWDNISSESGEDLNFLASLIERTKASFYPGHISGFACRKLTFRINLTLSTSCLSYSLVQIAEYLQSYAT